MSVDRHRYIKWQMKLWDCHLLDERAKMVLQSELRSAGNLFAIRALRICDLTIDTVDTLNTWNLTSLIIER